MKEHYEVETFYSLEMVQKFLNDNKIPSKHVISVVYEEGMAGWCTYRLLYVRTKKGVRHEKTS